MPELRVDTSLRLYTIAYCCTHDGTANLRGIFAAEDAINRSAPTHEELERELSILLSASLIAERNGDYELTDSGLRYYDQVNEIDGDVFQRLRILRERLADVVDSLELSTPAQIDCADFDEAYRSYYDGA